MSLPETIDKRLIIFTRYPEPGITKTRLIPALGAVGAATLQRQMTEYVLAQAQLLQSIERVGMQVRFAGGNKQLMQNWLGNNIECLPQGDGDLGQKMANSLVSAFQNQT